MSPRDLLLDLFRAALEAADPARVVPPALPARPAGRVVVVGAGKAAPGMAAAVAAAWPGVTGVVATRHAQAGAGAIGGIEVLGAGHPLPDAGSEAAGRRLLAAVSGRTADDLVLCLLSGGGSALAAVPAPGWSLAGKQAVTAALLRSGAPIADVNRVRRHLSALKGGRLAAAAWPAAVVTLAVSDVPGDDAATLASGPTVADPSTAGEARAVLARHGIDAPGPLSETPKPGDPRLARATFRLVGGPGPSLAAAAARARALGLAVHDLGVVEGEAAAVAARHAALARETTGPCVLLSAGETTVTLGRPAGSSRGGRNTEYALALALALDGLPGVHALAADTDGIDGTGPAAGGFAGPDTLARCRAAGLDPAAALAAHDSGSLLAAVGDALVTGPTGTNVSDFRAILRV